MDTFLGRYKNLIVLAAILFAQIIALAVQVRRPTQGGDTRLLRLWAISAVTPIEKAVVHSQKWVYDTWNTYAYLRGVRRENRQLREDRRRCSRCRTPISASAPPLFRSESRRRSPTGGGGGCRRLELGGAPARPER